MESLSGFRRASWGIRDEVGSVDARRQAAVTLCALSSEWRCSFGRQAMIVRNGMSVAA